MNKDRLHNKLKIVNMALAVLFAAGAMWLLAVDGANYLRKIESLSLFLPTSDFFAEKMLLPGGLLAWAATFLTQTFFHPWLGAAVYVSLLLLASVALMRAFRLPRWAFVFALLLPAAMLKALLDMGYIIFSLKTPGFAFLMPLGVLAALQLADGCSRIKAWWLRALAVVAITAVGYCVLGFYGLLAAALCCVAEVAGLMKRRWASAVNVAVALVSIALVPQVYFNAIPSHLRIEDKYTCQLPWLYEGESLWTSYSDDNFRLTLDLDRALQDGEWGKAIEAAAAHQDFEPTRLNVILTDMALLRSGKIADQLLKFRTGSADYKTERALRVTHDAGAMQFAFHTGHVNYAYRWAMENKVEYGLNVEQLKMMVKCALLNGESELARKCLDNLALTMFHKDWAAHYYKYVEQPALIERDAELAAVKKLMHSEEGFSVDHGQLEGYVWKELANVRRGNNELLELSMAAAMICFEIDNFADRVTYYYNQKKSLPYYFQQAVLFWSKHNENNFYEQFPIEQSVLNSYEQFMQMAQAYQQYGEEEQTRVLREAFGDTYWFYCYFVSGELKVI